PDGKEIAFTYRGDIYKVPVSGGTATRLTSRPSYESNPVWSPDGKSIAFASDREGSLDIFIMSADGGDAKRLTSNSTDEIPETFSPDGKNVIFSAAIQDVPTNVQFPSRRLTEVYIVPVSGGRSTQLLSTPAQMISFIPGTENFVYQDQKGMENEWRKHHTSSVTRDLWLYDAASGKHTNLTRRGGEDRNPVVSADGRTVYFLSERDGGSFNVFSFPIDNPSAVKAVTDFTTHPVRFLSQGADGTMAFAYDGEIYTMRDGSRPAKVNIDITVDNENPIKDLSVTSGASEVAVSPDGNQVALIKRGEVFVTSVEYKTTKQITHTAAGESDVTWGPDNRTLYYASERDGAYNIYRATIGRKDDPNFPNATIIKEEAVFPVDGVERFRPVISPDGNKMAYIQDRNKIMVRDLNSGTERQLTDGSTYPQRDGGFHFSWSPDSKWLVAEIVDRKHDPYYDIAIINAATGEITNITNSGYFDMNPRWVMNGNAILFESEKYGMRNHASWGSMSDAMLVFLNREAYDKFRLNEEDYALLKEVEKSQKKEKSSEKDDSKDKKKKGKKKESVVDDSNEKSLVNVELHGISDRIVRLTPFSSSLGDIYVTDDGEKLYFMARIDDGFDLWSVKLRSGDVELAKKLGMRGASMQHDEDGKNLLLLGSSSMK
ncbi:MAG: peptidase S41, partial [Duncaniella sp.]|nr:peptidase S41 [Duncaniella sp.]